jgi:hypothetical protein
MPAPQKQDEDADPTPYLFVSLEQKRIDQTKPYDAKKACWIPDEKEGYLLGEIKATKGDIVSVGLPGGEVRTSWLLPFALYPYSPIVPSPANRGASASFVGLVPYDYELYYPFDTIPLVRLYKHVTKHKVALFFFLFFALL